LTDLAQILHDGTKHLQLDHTSKFKMVAKCHYYVIDGRIVFQFGILMQNYTLKLGQNDDSQNNRFARKMAAAAMPSWISNHVDPFSVYLKASE